MRNVPVGGGMAGWLASLRCTHRVASGHARAERSISRRTVRALANLEQESRGRALVPVAAAGIRHHPLYYAGGTCTSMYPVVVRCPQLQEWLVPVAVDVPDRQPALGAPVNMLASL